MRTRSVHSPPRTEARMAPILWCTASRLSTTVTLTRPFWQSASRLRATSAPAYPLYGVRFSEQPGTYKRRHSRSKDHNVRHLRLRSIGRHAMFFFFNGLRKFVRTMCRSDIGSIFDLGKVL
jgi:hypothetical protein